MGLRIGRLALWKLFVDVIGRDEGPLKYGRNALLSWEDQEDLQLYADPLLGINISRSGISLQSSPWH